MSSNLRGMKTVAAFVENNVNEEGDAVTGRPTSTALFCVDSDDRYANYGQRRTNPTYPFRLNIQKNESLLNGFFRRLALTEFRLNWTLPNISKAWGNNQLILKWKEEGTNNTGQITITVPDAFYGAEELAAELMKQMNPLPSSGTPVVPWMLEPDDLFALEVSINYNEDDFYVFNPPIYITGGVTKEYGIWLEPLPNQNQRQLFDMLVLPAQSDYVYPNTPSNPTSTILSGIPNLRCMDYFDLVCAQLTYNQNMKDNTSASNSRDMLCRIYLDDGTPSRARVTQNVYTFPDTPATDDPVETITPQTSWDDNVNGVTPFVIYRQFSYPKQIRWSGKQPIGNLTFEMYDDQGRNMQDLWDSAYPPTTTEGIRYANSFVWNFSLLASED